MNKVFEFDTIEAANKAEKDIKEVLTKWVINHPHYDCRIGREVTDTGFKLYIDCYDITNFNSRLN